MHNFGGRQVIRKGTWSDDEDTLLRNCIDKYGEGNWHQVPVRAGLNRCRKSCRLRWLNYLKSNIKRGQFNEDEKELIMRLHKLLGNRWSLIAGRIPGRTANDVKNYWNTHMLKSGTSKQNINKNKQSNNNNKNRKAETIIKISSDGMSRMQKTKVIRPKARVTLKSKTSVVVGDDQEQYYYGTSSVPPLAYDIMYWPSDDNNDSNNITTPIIPVHDDHDHDHDSSLLSYFDDNLWV